MSFRPITKDETLVIHSAVVARFGGIDGVRDEGLLESALGVGSLAGSPLRPSITPRTRRAIRWGRCRLLA